MLSTPKTISRAVNVNKLVIPAEVNNVSMCSV
jgi:hypothetical protein